MAMVGHDRSIDTMMHGHGKAPMSDDEAFEYACQIWFEAPERAAEELGKLTTDERERVWADLSGNREISNYQLPTNSENPSILQRCFRDFHRVLQEYKVQSPETPLGRVLIETPDYVNQPSYMIRYLRACDYSVPAALNLMARHFDMRAKLFAEIPLGRDIVLSDLNEKDMEFLSHGAYQYMSDVDRAGRCIAFLHVAEASKCARNIEINALRAMFYRNTVASELENVQRLGIVRLAYFHNSYPHGGPDQDLIRLQVQIIDAVPIRCVAFYLLSGDSVWAQTVNLMILLATPFLRVRTRTMCGSYYENMYTLLCLGIPTKSFPAREDGTVMKKDLLAWIEQRRGIEEMRSNSRL